jgi:hypothetical protein
VKYLSGPSEWATAIFASVVMGGVSFGIDMVIGLFNNPKLSPIEAGTKVGSPFGFPLTMTLCPGFTMFAIAGLLRSLLLRSGATSRGESQYHFFGSREPCSGTNSDSFSIFEEARFLCNPGLAFTNHNFPQSS